MKRNPFVEQERRYLRRIKELVPVIYAAFALALHEEGFGFKRIVRVLAETQSLWNRHAAGELNIIEECSEKLGIDMMSETTARTHGVQGDAHI